ncbi:MAG: MFS transporter [Bacteroidetes bacterium]|nr:MFS transporter [Bacteroidota bacterium]
MIRNSIEFLRHKPSFTMGFLLAVPSLLLGIWVAALPAIKLRLGFTDATLGLSLFVAPLGALTGVLLSSRLFRRIPVGKWLVLGNILICILYAVQVTATNRPVFWLMLFATGFIGLCNGVSVNAVIDTIEKRYKRRIMSSCHGMYSLGGGISAGLAFIFYSVHLPSLYQIIIVAIAIIIVIIRLRPHLYTYTEKIHSDSSLAAPPASILGLAFICFVTFMGEGSIADWSAIYLRESLHSTAALASLGFAGFSVMMALGRLNGDDLVPRTGPKKIVIYGSLIAAAGFLLAVALPWKITAILGFTIVGLGFSCIVPILFSAAANVPGISPAMGIASITSGGLIGFLFGPSLIGLLSEKINLAAGLSLVFLLSLASAFVGSRNRFLARDTNVPIIELP